MPNPFTKSAKQAKERGEDWLARRITVEGKMAKALVKAIIERGYTVTVDDGEEVVVTASKDVTKITNAMFQSDEDNVYAVDSNGKKVAWFYLVYGNSGYDVVSNFTANAIGDDIWDNVLSPLSDKFEKEMER